LIDIIDFLTFWYSQGGFAMKDDVNPGIAYWRPFLERFSTLPEEDQMAIIEKYEEAERQGRDFWMWRKLKNEAEVKLQIEESARSFMDFLL